MDNANTTYLIHVIENDANPGRMTLAQAREYAQANRVTLWAVPRFDWESTFKVLPTGQYEVY